MFGRAESNAKCILRTKNTEKLNLIFFGLIDFFMIGFMNSRTSLTIVLSAAELLILVVEVFREVGVKHCKLVVAMWWWYWFCLKWLEWCWWLIDGVCWLSVACSPLLGCSLPVACSSLIACCVFDVNCFPRRSSSLSSNSSKLISSMSSSKLRFVSGAICGRNGRSWFGVAVCALRPVAGDTTVMAVPSIWSSVDVGVGVVVVVAGFKLACLKPAVSEPIGDAAGANCCWGFCGGFCTCVDWILCA